MLAVKTDSPIPIPGTPIAEGRTDSHKLLSSAPSRWHVYAHTLTNKYIEQKYYFEFCAKQQNIRGKKNQRGVRKKDLEFKAVFSYLGWPGLQETRSQTREPQSSATPWDRHRPLQKGQHPSARGFALTYAAPWRSNWDGACK